MNKKISALAFGMLLIGGCGGGGGDGGGSTSATSTASFPVAQAVANNIATGESYSASVTGTVNSTKVTGTATLAGSAAAGDTFEGQAVLSRTNTVNLTLSDGTTTLPIADSTKSFYTTNYQPIGDSSTGSYCVANSPLSYPASAKVGGTGVVGSGPCYADSSKAVQTGTEQVSYLMEKDTASTAILNLIDDSFNSSNTLISSEQDRYRIDTTGHLTLTSIDLTQTTGGNTLVLKLVIN